MAEGPEPSAVPPSPLSPELADDDVAWGVRQVLERTGEVELIAHGHSMLPLLWPGVCVGLRACAGHQAKVGDVVLYEDGETLLLHRLVGHDGSQLKVRGDNQRGVVRLEHDQLLARLAYLKLGGTRLPLEVLRESPLAWGRAPVARLSNRVFRTLAAASRPMRRLRRDRGFERDLKQGRYLVRQLVDVDAPVLRRFLTVSGLAATRQAVDARLELARGQGSHVMVLCAGEDICGLAELTRPIPAAGIEVSSWLLPELQAPGVRRWLEDQALQEVAKGPPA